MATRYNKLRIRNTFSSVHVYYAATLAELEGIADVEDNSFGLVGPSGSEIPYIYDNGAWQASVSSHASNHENGGADEINVAGLSGLLADGQTPLAHKTSHQDGGSDELSVTGLSGLLADKQTPLPAGSDTQIQFNDNGVQAGDDDLTWDKVNGVLRSGLADSGRGDIITNGTYFKFHGNRQHELLVENSLSSASLKVTGGGNAASFLELISTYGTGATDYIRLACGTNGSNEGLRVLSSGAVDMPVSLTVNGGRVLGVIEETTTSTGTVNDFDLDGDFTYLRCNNASALVLTGFTVDGATPTHNAMCIIDNVGSSTVKVAHQTGSTTANRIICQSTNGQIIGANGRIKLVYDADTDRWRATCLDPGTPIAVAHGGLTFSSTAGTWTVASGDLIHLTYSQRGKFVSYSIDIQTSSCASAGARLDVSESSLLPGGFTVTQLRVLASVRIADNGVFENGYFICSSAVGALAFQRGGVGNFTNSTDNTGITGTITLEVD